MVKVTKKKGETTRRLVSRFKDKVMEENIIDEARGGVSFESPSEKRKKKKYRLERIFRRERSNE